MKTANLVICAMVSACIGLLLLVFQPSSTPHPDPKLRTYESVSVVNKQEIVSSNKYRTIEDFVITVQLSNDTYKKIDITEDWYNEIEIGQDINLPTELVNVDHINLRTICGILIAIMFCIFFLSICAAMVNDDEYVSINDAKPKVDI